MATDDELRDLSERIARLNKRELLRVLGMAGDVEERHRSQMIAENLAADAALLEAEKRLREAGLPLPYPLGAKREAG